MHTSMRMLSVFMMGLLSACSVAPHGADDAAASVAAAAAPTAKQEDYSALAEKSGGQVYVMDAARSRVRIYAYRGGRAAQAGHNHVLTAPSFSGSAYVPEKSLAQARLQLRIPLADLQIDDPEVRAQTGGSFAKPLAADAIAGTREHMLGADNFDAARYPDVLIRSVSVTGELPMLVLQLAVTLHGQTRELWVPVRVSLDDTMLTASGAFALRQTDFGVKPYSVLGGLLAVQDAVAIEFTLLGHQATR